ANENGTPYYTNSSHLPVGYTEDIFSALDVQDNLQTLYTSGTVFHAFLGEKLPDWKAAANLVRKIAENYRLPYYTMSPTYSVCKNHGYITGEVFECPECGEKTEVYSRITGYYRPIQNWNDGKAQEYQDRKEYDIGHSKLCHAGPMVTVSSCVCEQGVDDSVLVKQEEEDDSVVIGVPVMYVKDHCPKCKGAEQKFKLAKVEFEVVNCSENMDIARELNIQQTPTIIDPDGTRYVGDTAAAEWLKAHADAGVPAGV
ncbi:MAG: ribonucleoside triphosphate reductase, partial [Clostridiales bacterium]|nr:ribonucleoside triphosphate reductase [Clostridiales bacterium]